MTACQRQAVIALSNVSFGMAWASRRFARDMAAKPEEYELTPYQAGFLWRLCWTYRRQLPHEVVDLAAALKDEPLPPRPAKGQPKKPVQRAPGRLDRAAAALSRPLRFGDQEQIEARKLASAVRVLKGISHAR